MGRKAEYIVIINVNPGESNCKSKCKSKGKNKGKEESKGKENS
jgi:hypothetical protein